jgi:hypothetical protein
MWRFVAPHGEAQRKGWSPKLGVLGNFTEANVRFAKDQGLMSIGLWADPGTSLDADRITDGAVEKVRASTSELRVSVLGAIMNHIAPDADERTRVTRILSR